MEKEKKTIKKLMAEERKQLSKAIKVDLDQTFEDPKFKQFWKDTEAFMRENQKPTKISHQLVPFRYNGMCVSESDEKRCYFLDCGPAININHYDIYCDVMEWFWQNSDYTYDYTYKNPPYELNEKNKKILFKTTTEGNDFYNISKFGTKVNGTEYFDHDGYKVLCLNDERIKKIRSWLKKRGWPEYAIVSPDECPCFLRSIDEKRIDRIIILRSLLSWNLYSKKQQNNLINKFEEDGFKYYKKAGSVLVDKWRIRPSIFSGDFESIKFPIGRY